MRNKALFVPLLLLPLLSWSQDFKVEYDKKADLSQYKSFQFGEGEIITPKDLRQVPDTTLHRWIRNAVSEELTGKGLQQVDSAGDLVLSYIAGSQVRSDAGSVGPGGLTPGGSFSQTYLRDYRQGSLVIDLNNPKSTKLIWRISATTDTGMAEAKQSINRIVAQGFKKFSLQPKKEKKKK